MPALVVPKTEKERSVSVASSSVFPPALRGWLLLAALGASLCAGCSRDASKAPPPDSRVRVAPDQRTPKPKPMPWLKPDAAPPKAETPDESGITDLKAVSPREIVRRYLTLSTEGDLTKLRPLVAKQCYATAVGVATATAAFGARLELSGVKVEPATEKGNEATVKYRVTGNITKRDPKLPIREEKNMLGKPLKLRSPGATLQGVERAGQLALKKQGGQWWIVCPKLPKVKAGVLGHKVGPVHIPHLGPHRPGEGHDDHELMERLKRGPQGLEAEPAKKPPPQKKSGK